MVWPDMVGAMDGACETNWFLLIKNDRHCAGLSAAFGFYNPPNGGRVNDSTRGKGTLRFKVFLKCGGGQRK